MLKIERKKLVKIVSAEILVCVIVSALVGLALLFGIIKGSSVLGQVMLSLLTLFIAGLFLLNSINAVTKGNKIGIFSAFMIIVSAVLFLLLIWVSDYFGSFGEIFNYAVVIVAMTSIFMNTVISHYIALGKSLIAVQAFFYLVQAYIELAVSMLIFGNSLLIVELWQVFVASAIVWITLYVVLKVKAKNIVQTDTETQVNGEYVTITKTEYENLKAEVERLRELAGNLSVPVTPAEDEERK